MDLTQPEEFKTIVIHVDMIQILAENSSFYATVKNWGMEFKWAKDSTENDPQAGHQEASTTD